MNLISIRQTLGVSNIIVAICLSVGTIAGAGQPIEGALLPGDTTLDQTGEFFDEHKINVQAGQQIVIDMWSDDFDTYLILVSPSGESWENDDWQGDTSWSHLAVRADAAGPWRVIATSYAPGEQGSYDLRTDTVGLPARAGDREIVDPATLAPQVRGVFVGIADYGGRIDPLNLTAEDAHVARKALQEGVGLADSALLQDRDATREAVAAAIEDLGSECLPGDVFVFFYSGHGGQAPVPEERRVIGPEGSQYEENDPDNVEETICLYDQDVTDNDLAEMLAGIPDGVRVLVVLDSCFAGGFAKDVICRPGYIGLFSSPEDVVSVEALELQAGGYLAHFFANAVGQHLADRRPRNQEITAVELCLYISEQYRANVYNQSGGRSHSNAPSKPGQPGSVDIDGDGDMTYHQFVFDRSGVSPHQVLFSW
jgi:hypothetical protein